MKKLISDKMRRAMDDMGVFTSKGRMADMKGRAADIKGRMADKMGRPNVMGRPDSGPIGMKGMADRMFSGDVSSTTPFRIQKPNMPQSSQMKPNTGQYSNKPFPVMKKGGSVKKYAGGGSVSSASKRADGVAHKGKTKGKMVKMAYGGKC